VSRELFPRERPEHYLIAHIDGGARGNPGPAAIAYAVAHQQKALLAVSDSELLVKQMKGQYKVRAPELQTLHKRAQEMLRQLDWFEIRHVRREQNRDADLLANAAMDSGMGKRAVEANAYAKKPPPSVSASEANGIVKNGVVEFLGEPLPEGTLVRVRAKD